MNINNSGSRKDNKMKIAKIFCYKSAAERLNKRNAERIIEHTSVSDALDSKLAKNINESMDSIARYAQRKNCHLEFVPGEDLFQNSAQMNVYKKGISLLLGNDGLPLSAFDLKSLSGQSILPNNAKGEDLVGFIRKEVKNIITNDKNWNNKIDVIK